VKPKPVIPRERAGRDIDAAIAWYLDQGAAESALGFIDALEQAFNHIGRHPTTGSPRYAHELNLPGLRSWQVARYPHMIFYIESSQHIDVWRVLHGQRDIPAGMQSTEPGRMPDPA
jgi:toxin ParE1/3/4